MSWIFRFVLAVAGFIFMLSLLVAGLIGTLLFVLWSLIRGRRPRIVVPRFGVPPGRSWGFAYGTRPGAGPHAVHPDDVVDIQAREVPDVPAKLEHRD